MLPVLTVCVMAPVLRRSSVPVPTAAPAAVPTPRFTAPLERTNALALLAVPLAPVFTLRLVTATSMPFAVPVPICPLVASVRFCAVMVWVPTSVKEPALSVTVLPVRSIAPPMVMAAVLSVRPITMGPVAPVAKAVSSAVVSSNWPAATAPTVMARLMLPGRRVKVPLVPSALLPALALRVTVSAVRVMSPLPAVTSISAFWV